MAAKSKVLPFPITVVEPEEDDHECPKCPPVGAPAWLATFADIATNLMAFFVLILGFAQFDQPSFEKMAGSMRETFGVHTIEGDIRKETIIELNNGPASQQGNDSGPRSEGGTSPNGSEAPSNSQAAAAAQALEQAIANGSLNIESDQGTVTVRLPEGSSTADAEALAKALANAAAGLTEQPADDAANPGSVGQQPDGQTPEGQDSGAGGQSDETGSAQPRDTQSGGRVKVSDEHDAGSPGGVRAKLTTAKLALLLDDAMGAGAVELERRDGKVFVTLGSGGAFASGSADLTAEAEEIIKQVAIATNGRHARITVTGHTDNVPFTGAQYGDNVGLASARASAVVRELIAKGTIEPERITAVGRGEYEPIADNATEEGRAKNRRIEIEVSFDEE